MNCVMTTTKTDGAYQHECRFCGVVRTSDRPVYMRSCDGAPPQSRGLGDTVAKVTRRLGVRKCGGCGRRQLLLNRLVPYRRRRGTK